MDARGKQRKSPVALILGRKVISRTKSIFPNDPQPCWTVLSPKSSDLASFAYLLLPSLSHPWGFSHRREKPNTPPQNQREAGREVGFPHACAVSTLDSDDEQSARTQVYVSAS